MSQRGSPSGPDWFSRKRENVISGPTLALFTAQWNNHTPLGPPASPAPSKTHGPVLRSWCLCQAQPHSSTIMLGTSRLTMLYSSSK